MNPSGIQELTDELNRRAEDYRIGELQDIRLELKLDSKPTSKIFAGKPPGDDYAFHTGSKSQKGYELQFNVGLMTKGPDSAKDGPLEVRHALAVSFQGGAYEPDDVVGEMLPKVRLFNQYLREHPDRFSDLWMWDHKDRRDWSGYRRPKPIGPSLLEKGRTIKLGRRLPPEEVEYEDILQLFDRLLPIYVYVESGGDADRAARWREPHGSFDFHSKAPDTPDSVNRKVPERELDITFLHARLQEKLYERLADKFGAENVGTEVPTGSGGRIDLVLRRPDSHWVFYEIKAGRSPRTCIRDAIGQLLEYALWPGSRRPDKVVVVGEKEPTKEADVYLRRLNDSLSIPVEYDHLPIST